MDDEYKALRKAVDDHLGWIANEIADVIRDAQQGGMRLEQQHWADALHWARMDLMDRLGEVTE